MEMDLNFWLQLLTVAFCIGLGGRYGGVGLGAAGGLDWMVKIAERMLRKWPKAITFVAPFVCLLFVINIGTK